MIVQRRRRKNVTSLLITKNAEEKFKCPKLINVFDKVVCINNLNVKINYWIDPDSNKEEEDTKFTFFENNI